jgi:N-acetylglucosamine-6-phosphate deacetylase
MMGRLLCLNLRNCDIVEGNRTVSYGRDVFVKGGRFGDPASRAEVRDYSTELSGLNVLPGMIDCQVNGAGGVLFEDICDEAALLSFDRCLAKRGTTRWCGTFISAPENKIDRVLKVVEHCAQPTGLIGFHFDGPWLNPKYRGYHPIERLASSSPAHIGLIERASQIGKALVTLAPEVISEYDLTRLRRISNIRICVGRSDASAALIGDVIGTSLCALTNTANWMPSISAETAGPFGAMMRTKECWSSLICDGEHICRDTFAIIKRATYCEKAFIVSNQMSDDMAPFQSLSIGSETIVVDGKVIRTVDRELAGGTLSMIECIKVAVSQFSVPEDEAIRMGTEYPAQFLGVPDKHGMIALGRHADMVVADNQFDVRAVFRDGERLV